MDLNSKFTTKALRFHIWECGPKSPSAFEIGGGEKRRKKKKKKTQRILSRRQFRNCLYKAAKRKEVSYFTLSILAFRFISSRVLLVLVDVKVVI